MLKQLCFKILRVLFRWFSPHQPVVTAQIQQVLVMKLCCLGDILFTTPLLRALRANFPRCQITYMLNHWCRELAAENPYVADIIEYDPLDKVGWWKKIQRTWRLVRRIRNAHFDVALILHRTPLAGVLLALAGVPVRIGFDWQGQGFALTHSIAFRAQVHEVDRDLDCLQPLNAITAGRELEWTPPESAQAWAEAFLASHAVEKTSRPLIAVFPAGGINPGTVMLTKRWSQAGYRRVCQYLVQYYGAQLLFIGSQEDQAVGDAILANETWHPQPWRTEGQTNLSQLAALLQRCDVFLGGDSGPLYLAEAVGTATVALFGPSSPQLVAPRGAQHRVVYAAADCSPCYNPVSVLEQKQQAITCQQGQVICMDSIQTEDVLAAVEELLLLKGYVRKI